MRLALCGLLVVLGACGGSEGTQTAGVDECFRDVAESYEQTVDVIDGDLGPLLADMGTATRDMLKAARTGDSEMLRDANDAYQSSADAIVALGDDFSRELDEARELEIDCPL